MNIGHDLIIFSDTAKGVIHIPGILSQCFSLHFFCVTQNVAWVPSHVLGTLMSTHRYPYRYSVPLSTQWYPADVQDLFRAVAHRVLAQFSECIADACIRNT